MNALGFAWRSLVRQPARATLGILGVAAVGALLFDMLLLSRGLIVSMQDLLDRGGWDIRVSAGELPAVACASRARAESGGAIAALPSVQAALVIRGRRTRKSIARRAHPLARRFEGVATRSTDPAIRLRAAVDDPPRARDADGARRGRNRRAHRRRGPSSSPAARSRCARPASAISKRCRPTRLKVVGVAEFPFQATNESTTGGDARCAQDRPAAATSVDEADLILVTSTGDADETAAAIRALHPELNAATNNEVVGRLQQTGFTYFRQISSVLTTVTVVVCRAAHHRAADRLGQPAARRDRRAARARASLACAWSRTSSRNPR